MSSNSEFWTDLGRAVNGLADVMNTVSRGVSSARDIRDTYKAYEAEQVRNDPIIKRCEELQIKVKDLSNPFNSLKR